MATMHHTDPNFKAMMNPTDQFDDVPFVNEECGDTMWNDENLNPPSSQSKPAPSDGPHQTCANDRPASCSNTGY